jgi:hypothetical protein
VFEVAAELVVQFRSLLARKDGEIVVRGVGNWPDGIRVLGVFTTRNHNEPTDGAVVVLLQASGTAQMPWDGALVDPLFGRGSRGQWWFHGFHLRLGRYAR